MGKRQGNKISLTRKTTDEVLTPKLQDAEPSSPPGDKIKATLYLSPEVANRLDRVQFELRQKTGKRGHRLSRSAIVEASLIIALDEYEAKGEGSNLLVLLSDK